MSQTGWFCCSSTVGAYRTDHRHPVSFSLYSAPQLHPAQHARVGNLPVGTDGATGQQLPIPPVCMPPTHTSNYTTGTVHGRYLQSILQYPVVIGQNPPPMNGVTEQIFADCPSAVVRPKRKKKCVTVGKERKK